MVRRLVSPDLVGRRRELAVAAEMLERTRRGTSSHLLVAGEAGVGKTRFAETVGESARTNGFRVLRGGCVQLGAGELPYAPIAEALRTMARDLDPKTLAAVVADDGSTLARIVPALGPRGADLASIASPQTSRRHLLQALLGVLARLAEHSPVLLMVEDLHWADSASLATLSYLLRSLRVEPAGLLMTFRSDELHHRHPLLPWVGETERLATVERLELPRLDPLETRELIAAILGVEVSTEFSQRIHARSDGNPLLVEELLAADDRQGGPGELPPSLRDILLARIAAVPEGAQRVLGAAAVAGRRVDAGLLASVVGLPAPRFAAALEAAIGHGLLVAGSGEARDRLEFRHALIQEVVYDGLLPGERMRLHRAYAEALAAGGGLPGSADAGRWAELAHHWDAARDDARAFEAALRAADEAERTFAFEAAVAQYRRALAGWDIVEDPEAIAGFDRVELLSRAAEAAWLSGMGANPSPIGQIPLLREAIMEADRRQDAVRSSLLRGQLGLAQWVTGNPSEAHTAYREAVTTMPPGPPSAERARILAGLGQVMMLEGQDREACTLCEAAIAMAREVEDRAIEGHALNTLACSLGFLGQGDRAVAAMERSLALALELGEPDDIGRAYLNATEVLSLSGHDERALELVTQGVGRAATMGLEVVHGVFISLHGSLIAFELGRWAEAGALASPGHLDDLDPASEVYALAHLVEMTIASGHWDVGRAQLARMSELLSRFPTEYQYTGPYSCARAELALWEGHPRAAVDAVAAGLDRLERTDDVRYRVRLLRLGLRGAADLAEVARDRRDGEEGSAALELAASIRSRTEAALDAIAAMQGGLANELAAEAATITAEESRLRGAADPASWREAAARWQARGRPYHRAYAGWRQAEASLALGDRPSAMATLRDAHTLAERLGAQPLVAAIAALGRRARIPLEDAALPTTVTVSAVQDPAIRAASDLGLTPREREVLELVAGGLTNRQIAEALFISENTVGVHVSRILGKLGATSRTEAAGKAYRLGIVAR